MQIGNKTGRNVLFSIKEPIQKVKKDKSIETSSQKKEPKRSKNGRKIKT